MKTKESKRIGKQNSFWLKNGGGQKEDLIKQICDINDEIDSIHEESLQGSRWCKAPGPNMCDSLEKRKKTLIEQFDSQFPGKKNELDDAIKLREKQKKEAEKEHAERELQRKKQELELKHKQWMKEQDDKEKLRLAEEYKDEINSYRIKIQKISTDHQSLELLEQERIYLEMSYDNDVKLCRDDAKCLNRLKQLYDGKKKILMEFLPKRGGGIYHGFDGNAGGYDLSPYQKNYVPQTVSNHAEQRIHPYSGGGGVKTRTRKRHSKHAVSRKRVYLRQRERQRQRQRYRQRRTQRTLSLCN